MVTLVRANNIFTMGAWMLRLLCSMPDSCAAILWERERNVSMKIMQSEWVIYPLSLNNWQRPDSEIWVRLAEILVAAVFQHMEQAWIYLDCRYVIEHCGTFNMVQGWWCWWWGMKFINVIKLTSVLYLTRSIDCHNHPLSVPSQFVIGGSPCTFTNLVSLFNLSILWHSGVQSLGTVWYHTLPFTRTQL